MKPVVTVRELMATDVRTVRPDLDLFEAAALLLRHGVSGLPVVDDDGRLVGILTEQDCLRSAFAIDYYRESVGRVRDAMTADPRTVEAGANVMLAIELFLANAFRRLPVVDDGRLVGILSRRDALRLLCRPL